MNKDGSEIVCLTCGVAIEFEGENPINGTLKNKKIVGKGQRANYVCLPCNRLSSRIYSLRKNNPCLANPFHPMNAEEKRQWFLDHSACFGPDLLKELKTMVAVTTVTEDADVFNENGSWLDEADLKKKYEGKPEQLASVMKNAR